MAMILATQSLVSTGANEAWHLWEGVIDDADFLFRLDAGASTSVVIGFQEVTYGSGPVGWHVSVWNADGERVERHFARQWWWNDQAVSLSASGMGVGAGPTGGAVLSPLVDPVPESVVVDLPVGSAHVAVGLDGAKAHASIQLNGGALSGWSLIEAADDLVYWAVSTSPDEDWDVDYALFTPVVGLFRGSLADRIDRVSGHVEVLAAKNFGTVILSVDGGARCTSASGSQPLFFAQAVPSLAFAGVAADIVKYERPLGVPPYVYVEVHDLPFPTNWQSLANLCIG